MRNWQELVRQRLWELELDAGEKEEVHAELAAHLEESYRALLNQGLSEQVAFHRALSQVSDWRDLQRKIFVAKKRGDLMQKRVQQLWIPGFLTFILSTIFLMTLQKLGFRPRIVWSGANEILFYAPWLVSLLFVGALGAYLSSRAGGSRGAALFVSVFPVLALAAAFLLMFPIDMVVEPVVGNHVDFRVVASELLKEGIGWLLIPGAALLAGGLLAQLLFSRGPSSQRTEIGSETTHA